MPVKFQASKTVAIAGDEWPQERHADRALAHLGTTLIAAQKTGRAARLIEIDPSYCDAIVRRWQTFAREAARLEETGETFGELSVRRSAAEIMGVST
jgi:hypothetical protein